MSKIRCRLDNSDLNIEKKITEFTQVLSLNKGYITVNRIESNQPVSEITFRVFILTVHCIHVYSPALGQQMLGN